MSRNSRFHKVADKMMDSLDKKTRAITIAIFNGTIQLTRVDTGRARGNWQLSIGTPRTGVVALLDPSGAKAMESVISGIKSFELNILTNNLPYIKKLEELDGMAARPMARIKRILKENAA